MNPLYNLAIHCYAGAARLAARGSAKVADMIAGQKKTVGDVAASLAAAGADGYDVWIHAASLGEFEQGRPLIERLRREHPGLRILLTFFSPSGYRVRHAYDKVDAVAYLPFDTPARVREFLDAARPSMAIFVKYEFWGNYLQELGRRGVPTYIISAIFRPSQAFFKPWGGWSRRMLRCFRRLYVQDERSRELLGSIGIEDVTVAGDTRFDRVTDIVRSAHEVPVIARFAEGSKMSIVVGSSWQPDEDIYVPWLNDHPEVKAVIAPHEFDQARLRSLLDRFGRRARLLSELKSPDDLRGDEHVVIVDCFGLLSSIYRYGDAAWVGGGFGAGIHNINEAAVYGIPVVFGPKHQKFKEAADLMAAGGGLSVANAAEGRAVLDKLLASPAMRKKAGEAAAAYIRDNIGATDIIYRDLFSGIRN